MVFLRRNTRPGAPQIYPCSFLRQRVHQWTFSFGLVCLEDICTWKTKVGPILPQNRLRLTRNGSFHIQVQDFTKCLRMSAKMVTPRTYICHIPTLNQTCTHMVGPHASFPGIPTLWWSFSGETLDRGPRRSTPVAFSVRGMNNGLFLFWFV